MTAYGWRWVDAPVADVRDTVRDAARLPDWLELVGTVDDGDLLAAGSCITARGPNRRGEELMLHVDRVVRDLAWITVSADGRPRGQWYLAASPWHGGTAVELMLVPAARRAPVGWRPAAARRSLGRLAGLVASPVPVGAASTHGRTARLIPQGDVRPPVHP